MNCCLVVVDSLRWDAVESPKNPFFHSLQHSTVVFERAYATECWTLPTHISIFTGLLPSEHQAHFQTMEYRGRAPTIAEILSREGFHTEVVTRNSIFDGSLPGVTRGFQHNTRPLADVAGINLMSAVLAFSKPRFRRQIETTGFFHPLQRENREFVKRFARATVPADREALAYVVERIHDLRRRERGFFIFANLYDVHAPYPPSEKSIFRPLLSRAGIAEMLRMPLVLPRLGGHAYLEPGFRISTRSRELLQGRYRTAVRLMGEKLTEFYSNLRDIGALDDTLLIVTSDHGEAFGDHGLYLHDSSVWQTHLHVPLYVHHPALPPTTIDDCVSMRDIFGLIRGATLGDGRKDTILDPGYRQRRPIAIAEHFYSPWAKRARPEFQQNLATAICGTHKAMVRREGVAHTDLALDPSEEDPRIAPLMEFERACSEYSVGSKTLSRVMEHLRNWRH